MDFDFIIVGAGSAGCVLADRLSASGRYRVLLLEAGGSDARLWIKVPLGYAFTFSDPRVNWCYHAAPDPGLNGRSAFWPRGRVIGGSSSINAMAYVRGLALDYDDWEAAGATGWGWTTVRGVFERLESHSDAGPNGKAVLRGDGPVHVSDLSRDMHPFSARFFDAAKDLGWPLTDDMNGPRPEGLSYYRSNVRGGVRFSAADAFLRPALKRGNVELVKHAAVERLAFDGRRVTGVHYRHRGTRVFATAGAEVILSAGSVNSPQILQLSGIGPSALLSAQGIEVIQELSQVGQGLQDHLTLTHYFTANTTTLNNRLGRRLGRVTAGLQYALTRRGPLGVPVNQVGGLIRSDPTQAAPDVQVYCNPASYSVPASGPPKVDRDPGFLLSVQPCRPTSRGEIGIVSRDPDVAPRIQPNSLATEEDRAQALRVSNVLRALATTPTIARLVEAPKAPDIIPMSEAEMLENFRARATSNYHPSCTCRMGRDGKTSVVDARLRVHGVGSLRVVDASAFPNITSGNTNAPTMMLALRAADLILEDARQA